MKAGSGLPAWVYALALSILALVGVPGEAFAGAPYGVVTVDLQPERGEVPTDVCVVSQSEGPRTRTKVHGGLLGERLAGSARARAYGLSSDFWKHGGEEQSACGEGQACAPRVSLPPSRDDEGLWAACATDELLDESASGVERRLLVIVLEHLEGSPPAIEALRLTGGIVTIGVRARLDDIVVTARSAGGHFLPSARSVRAQDAGSDAKLIVLPVQPRCDWLALEARGKDLSGLSSEELKLRIHGEPADPKVCSRPVLGTRRLAVLAPRGRSVGEISIRLPESAGEGGAHFRASWDGAWPNDVLRLSQRQADFSWRRPACIYPENSCPKAVVEGGIACTVRSDEQGCHYLCPGDDAAEEDPSLSVSAPTTVTFSDERQNQRWTQILQRSGQILEGFVEPDRVYLEADVSDWERKVPGSRVTHLEVLGNDGSVRRYALDGASSLRLRAPEAGCDPLRYRLVGDRHYLERTAEVRGGQVLFEKPEASVRPFDFYLSILQGGGPAVPFGQPMSVSNPIYFTGQAQLAAAYRPRKPKWARISYELRIGGTIGQWGYFDEQSHEVSPIQVRERVLWARFLAEPALMVDVWGPIALGGGVGFGSSWPIRTKETNNTSRFRFIVSPSLEARIRVRSWLYIEAQTRFVFREQTQIAIPDGAGRFRREAFNTVSILGLYGLGFRF